MGVNRARRIERVKAAQDQLQQARQCLDFVTGVRAQPEMEAAICHLAEAIAQLSYFCEEVHEALTADSQ